MTPNYYSIIPANVRYDNRLTPNAKLLYAEITALCNMNGNCFATNDYFATLYDVSKVSISKWISQLVEYGYIKSEITYKEGSKEIDKRYLTILNYPIKENFNTPHKENLMDNNTSMNNNLTDSNIKPAFDKWIAYKKEKRQPYKPIGLQTCLKKLEELSGNNPDIAMQIVDESISNNWAGLFPLKEKPKVVQVEQPKEDESVYIEVGEFYIDDTEKYSKGYSDLAKQLTEEQRENLWHWFIKNFQCQNLKISFIRKVLQKAINEGGTI